MQKNKCFDSIKNKTYISQNWGHKTISAENINYSVGKVLVNKVCLDFHFVALVWNKDNICVLYIKNVIKYYKKYFLYFFVKK